MYGKPNKMIKVLNVSKEYQYIFIKINKKYYKKEIAQ